MNKEIADALRKVSDKIDEYGVEDTYTPSDIVQLISTALWHVAEDLYPTPDDEDPS